MNVLIVSLGSACEITSRLQSVLISGSIRAFDARAPEYGIRVLEDVLPFLVVHRTGPVGGYDVVLAVVPQGSACAYGRVAAFTRALRRDGSPVAVIAVTDGDLTGHTLLLSSGVDYCLTFPLDYTTTHREHLIAVVDAVTRSRTNLDQELRIAGLVLKVQQNRLVVPATGETVYLHHKELLLLETLMRRPNIVFSRDRLCAALWGDTFQERYTDVHTADAHVHQLRSKMAKIWGERAKACIRSVRSVGFSADTQVIERLFPVERVPIRLATSA